jgi:hypothetical protein
MIVYLMSAAPGSYYLAIRRTDGKVFITSSHKMHRDHATRSFESLCQHIFMGGVADKDHWVRAFNDKLPAAHRVIHTREWEAGNPQLLLDVTNSVPVYTYTYN